MSRFLAALLPLLAAAPLAAQMPPRTLLVEHWTRHRAMVLSYFDAMPDSAMRFRPVDGERDFAEQMYHLAYVNQLAFRQMIPAATVAGPADTAALLRNRKALRSFTARSFDDVITYLRAAPDSVFLGEGVLFNQKRPRWQWLEVAREHTIWTLGQTVPYLRLNGVTPPPYQPF